MARIINTKSARRRKATFVAGLVLCTLFALASFTGSADAQGRGRGHRDYHHNWNGGYYRAPPVIYGSPYRRGYYGAPGYYPPPMVYGPGLNFNFNIR